MLCLLSILRLHLSQNTRVSSTAHTVDPVSPLTPKSLNPKLETAVSAFPSMACCFGHHYSGCRRHGAQNGANIKGLFFPRYCTPPEQSTTAKSLGLRIVRQLRDHLAPSLMV